MEKRLMVFVLRISAGIVFLASVCGCTHEQQKPEVTSKPAVEVAAKTTLIATIKTDEKPHDMESQSEHKTSTIVQGHPAAYHVAFAEQGTGAAYVARRGSSLYVVVNDRPGKSYRNIRTRTLAISPDGRRVAYGTKIGDVWYMIVDDKEEGPFAEIGPAIFSPDSKHVAYEVQIGEKWHIQVDGSRSPAAVSYYVRPEFSGDSHNVLYIENGDETHDMRTIVSDLEFKNPVVVESSGRPLIMNHDRTRVATVRFEKSKKRMIEFPIDRPDAVKKGPLFDAVYLLSFAQDGTTVAYIGVRGTERFIVMNDREERLPDGDLPEAPVVRPGGKGAGILMASDSGVYLHQAFYDDGAKKTEYNEAYELIYSRSGDRHAYTARRGDDWFMVVNGKEGPAFDRVVTPSFSPDGRYLVYRARKSDKRFVVVADQEGKTTRQHPGYEMVFPPVFTADGSLVAYGVKDGRKLIWKVEKLQ